MVDGHVRAHAACLVVGESWETVKAVRPPPRAQAVSGNRLKFGLKQRDTEGSERSEEADWARVYGNSLARATSQVLSYLRFAGLHVGLLFNFNVAALAAGGWKRVLRGGVTNGVLRSLRPLRHIRVKFLMS
jgi:hypothetical protein